MELLNASRILTLCKQPALLAGGPGLYQFSQKIPIVSRFATAILKNTFFNHFCAGENLEETKRTIEQYRRQGVQSLPDRSTEDANNDAETVENLNRMLRTIESFKSSIDSDNINSVSTKQIEKPVTFIPIKLTAYTTGNLLKRISNFILYSQICSQSPQDPNSSSTSTPEFFSDKKQVTPLPPFLQNEFYPASKAFPGFQNFSLENSTPPKPWTPEEQSAYEKLLATVDKICEQASNCNIKLLLDAERTALQPSIVHFARVLQRKWNKNQALIYNTFQMYLKENEKNLAHELEEAKKNGYILGVKLVRGAYMESEAKTAKNEEVENPVRGSKEETDEYYNEAIKMLMENIEGRVALFMGTHNLKSAEVACREMGKRGMGTRDGRVHFGQLMGMCDDLTFGLANKRYNIHKLLPFGKINDVFPYLLRRVQENSSVLSGTSREIELMQREIARRAKEGKK
eukprot:TRINITY_DN22290_c0_g1_i1.p1 TRINITY_DN22290_c0_g1~~TRINITY_DN22290_c0_g1_i1.p1  ORF type:complete len:522 (+),score=130.94 TRINITY_DN22290_c0_g1_i1:195-1568(+)